MNSLIAEIKAFIHRAEEDYADLVWTDFQEGLTALPTQAEQIAYCFIWIRMYQCLT